jgi:hypothetical protein
MKVHPDDPRLSAYVIGELSAADRAEVERALATSPVIRNSVSELRKVVRILEDSLGGDPMALDSLRLERVMSAARQADAAEQGIALESGRRSWRGWWVSGAAAAAVAATLVVLAQIPAGESASNQSDPGGSEEAWQRRAREAALTPVAAPQPVDGVEVAPDQEDPKAAVAASPGKPGASDGEFLERVRREADAGLLPAAGEFPQLADAEFQAVPVTGEVPLPLVSGGSSWTWIRRYITERDALPPAGAVRIEEMLNAFPGRLGEDDNGLRVEIAECPWDSGNSLALVTVANPGADSIAVSLTAAFDSGTIAAYRLVGYAEFKNAEAGEATAVLAPGTSHQLIIELRPTGANQMPAMQVDLRGEKSARVATSASRLSWDAASDSFRFNALLACFGRALRAGAGSPDVEVLRSHLAAFPATSDSPERTEALAVIRRALTIMDR